METSLNNNLFMGKIFDPKIQIKFYGIDLVETDANVLLKDLVVDNLYIDFNVMLSNDTNVNTAAITIYNLRKLNRENLAQIAYNVIEVFAGYGEDINLIFNGEVTNIKNELDGADWKTTIYCASGMRLYEEVYFKKSYVAGTPYSTIIEDLCKASYYPYQIDKPTNPADGGSILLGRTYYGKIKDVLTQVCDDVGMHWYVLNGTLEVGFKGRIFTPDKFGVLLSYKTGMIGTPMVITRTIKEPKEVAVPNKKKGKKKNKNLPDKKETELVERQRLGLEITACLNPLVKPGRLINVASISDNSIGISASGSDEIIPVVITGKDLIADTVNFYGNNYGGDFAMKILADYPIAEDEQAIKLVTAL